MYLKTYKKTKLQGERILDHNKKKNWFMGNFDYKNIRLQIETREDFTDPRFMEFMKEENYTLKEYKVFLDSVWDTLGSEYSKRIVDFFISYRGAYSS